MNISCLETGLGSKQCAFFFWVFSNKFTKVADTRNQHLYVSCLCECQEWQNVAFSKIFKEVGEGMLENIVLDLQNIIIVPPAFPCASCMIPLVMQPYQEGECNAHGTSCLPMLPQDLKVPVHKNQ